MLTGQPLLAACLAALLTMAALAADVCAAGTGRVCQEVDAAGSKARFEAALGQLPIAGAFDHIYGEALIDPASPAASAVNIILSPADVKLTGQGMQHQMLERLLAGSGGLLRFTSTALRKENGKVYSVDGNLIFRNAGSSEQSRLSFPAEITIISAGHTRVSAEVPGVLRDVGAGTLPAGGISGKVFFNLFFKASKVKGGICRGRRPGGDDG